MSFFLEKTIPPPGKAATGATANAVEQGVDKLTTKFGSGLTTPGCFICKVYKKNNNNF